MQNITHSNQIIRFLSNAQENAKNKKSERIIEMLISIARHWSPKQNPFPSQDRIAAMSGVSVRSVRSYLRECEDMGIIRVKARFNASSVYVFNFDKLAAQICRLTRFNKLNHKITTFVKNSVVKAKAIIDSSDFRKTLKKSLGKQKAIKDKQKTLDKPSPMLINIEKANKGNDLEIQSIEQQEKNKDHVSSLLAKLRARK